MIRAMFSRLGGVLLVAGIVGGVVGVGVQNNSVALGGLTAGMAGGYYSLRRRAQTLSQRVSEVSQSISELKELNRQLPPLISPIEENLKDNISSSLTPMRDNIQELKDTHRQLQNSLNHQLQSGFAKIEGIQEGINTIIRQEVQFLQRIGGLEEFISTIIKKDVEIISRRIEEFNANIQPSLNKLLSHLNSPENSIPNLQQNLSESIGQLTETISNIQHLLNQLYHRFSLLEECLPNQLQQELEGIIQNYLPPRIQNQLQEVISNQFLPPIEAFQNSLPTQLQQQLREIVHSNIQDSTQELLSCIEAFQNSFFTQLKQELEGIIRALKQEIQLLQCPAKLTHDSAVDSIINLCRRFPAIAEGFTSNYNFSLQEERDVQKLFHILLILFFNDVRREVDISNHAGRNSRVDFAIPSHGILVEIKYPRGNTTRAGIVRQLAEDFESYREYPNLKTLVCFIYNATGTITSLDASTLENDLRGNRGGFNVYTIVSPK